MSALPALPEGPYFVPPYATKAGGVDFLGLRQVNLDLMSGALPGINNVTAYVRPFAVISWMYWKFHQLADRAGIAEPTAAQCRTFTEKVETLFTWGHVLENLGGIPGTDARPPTRADGRIPLDFTSWGREATNTSLMAAVQYGPAAKTDNGLGFVQQVGRGFYRTRGEGIALAEALERSLASVAAGEAMSLARAWATEVEARRLLAAWNIHAPKDEERVAFRRAFFQEDAIGQESPVGRRSSTIELIRVCLRDAGSPMPLGQLRRAMMCRWSREKGDHLPEPLKAAWARWIALQVRQAQRLGLEALLAWVERRILFAKERSTDTMADGGVVLLREATLDGETVGTLLDQVLDPSVDLDQLLREEDRGDESRSVIRSTERLEEALSRQDEVESLSMAVRLLMLCVRVTELLADNGVAVSECAHGGVERVSLAAWRRAVRKDVQLPVRDFLRRVLENFVLSQHFGVAVGRYDGRTQRLRIAIEEEGLVPLVGKPLVPRVTADRLSTCLSLMVDCGLLQSPDGGEFVLPAALG